jgi:hypothetical protein
MREQAARLQEELHAAAYFDCDLNFAEYPTPFIGKDQHHYPFVVVTDAIWDASNVRATGDYSPTPSHPEYRLDVMGRLSLAWTDPV